jgi:hypothetical protein
MIALTLEYDTFAQQNKYALTYVGPPSPHRNARPSEDTRKYL